MGLATHNLPSQAKLPSGTKNVRFVGIAKKPYTGDMAIDSVLLSKKGQAHSPLQLHKFYLISTKMSCPLCYLYQIVHQLFGKT